MGKPDFTKTHADSEVSSFVFYGSDTEAAHQAALSYAKDVGISSFDIVELSPEVEEKGSKGEIKIKAVRELIRQINLSPGHGKLKLAIIREADKLNTEAANALLKTLEEPPAKAKIILLSSSLRLLPTIRSRCQIVRFEDRENPQQEELLTSFESALNDNLKTAFKSAEKISGSNSLEQDFDTVISMWRRKMLSEKTGEFSKRIKLLIEAKKNLKMTTNKRLIIENLFLELKYGKHSN